LEACPNLDWRLIVALSRYGGLRCPSEVLSLRLTDIDWAAGRILVTRPKTEHHPGHDTRTIPLFPELRPLLLEAAESAPVGAVYVVNERFRQAAMGPRGWRGCNLRTMMEKIVRRAGLTPWPRLFHNMRGSRETELADRFPIQTVTGWMGNTPRIALSNYLQIRETDFAKAVEEPCGALQPALQQPAESPGKGQQGPRLAEISPETRQDQKTRPCKGLRAPATACAAVVSPYYERENGEDRIRTCGAA